MSVLKSLFANYSGPKPVQAKSPAGGTSIPPNSIAGQVLTAAKSVAAGYQASSIPSTPQLQEGYRQGSQEAGREIADTAKRAYDTIADPVKEVVDWIKWLPYIGVGVLGLLVLNATNIGNAAEKIGKLNPL